MELMAYPNATDFFSPYFKVCFQFYKVTLRQLMLKRKIKSSQSEGES